MTVRPPGRRVPVPDRPGPGQREDDTGVPAARPGGVPPVTAMARLDFLLGQIDGCVAEIRAIVNEVRGAS